MSQQSPMHDNRRRCDAGGEWAELRERARSKMDRHGQEVDGQV